MSKTIIFIFAGREANLAVQKPLLDRILADDPTAELHLWDLTRTPSDAAYLRTREGEHDGRVKVLSHLHSGHPIRCRYPSGERRRGTPPCVCMKHKPPYEEPYKWYAAHPEYAEDVFVKIDDDVLFLETERFGDLTNFVRTHTDQIASANVINNVVAAKYEPHLSQVFYPACGDATEPDNDRSWWELHISKHFARYSHNWFIERFEYLTNRRKKDIEPFRTREGEAISINCIAFSHRAMIHLAREFAANPRLGDEGAVDARLPWIVPTFRAAHLSFGPQEAAMGEAELQSYRDRYETIVKEYLG